MKRWLLLFSFALLLVIGLGFQASSAGAADTPANCVTCHGWNTNADVYAPNHDTVYDAAQWPDLSPDCKQGGCHAIVSPTTGNPNLWEQHVDKATTNFPGGMTCWSCHHEYPAGAKLDSANIQAQIAGNNTQCAGCHGVNVGGNHEFFHNTTYIDNPPVECSSCHPMVSQNTGQPNLWVWHLDRQTTTYNTGTGYADGMQCQGCHSYSGTKLSAAAIAAAIAAGDTKCDSCHENALHDLDPNLNHRTEFMGEPSFCAQSGCHEPSRIPADPDYPNSHNLQDYHVEKQTTSYPNGMTCDSCHNYSGSKLQKSEIDASIRDGNKACDACHDLETGGHEPTHDTQYDSDLWPNLGPDCRNCHPMVSTNTGNPNLWEWHLGRQTATYNSANGYPDGMTCQSCHDYIGTKLDKSAIDGTIALPNAPENKDCDTCHGLIHPAVESEHNTAWIDDKPVDCSTCHDGESSETGSSNLWGIHLGKTTTTFVFMDCDSCHSYIGDYLDSASVSSAINTGDTNCTACHAVTIHPMDPAPDHRTDFVGDPSFCTQAGCHAPSRTPKDAELNLQDFHVEKQTTSYPDGMVCDSCHNYVGSKLDKSVIDTAIAKGGMSGTPNTQCSACHDSSLNQGHEVLHNTVYADNPPIECAICHPMVSENTGQPNLWVWHLDRQTTTYNTGTGFPDGMQCASCHSYSGTKLSPADVANAIAAGDTRCEACHSLHELDPNIKHRTDFMGDPASCTLTGCHTVSRTPKDTEPNLQDFHVEKQTTSFPDGMTCESCHDYNGGGLDRANIDAAIANGDTACNACHTSITETGHEAQHTTLFDAGQPEAESLCSVCHITLAEGGPYTLWDVHIGKKATSYDPMECGTCHAYNGSKLNAADIAGAIAAGDKDCQACHTGIGTHAIEQSATLPSSVHVGNACSACHAAATSSVAKPARPDSSLATIPGSNVCLTCHNATGGAPDVQTSFTKTSRHATPTCYSCHNPHVADDSTTQAPSADGALKGTPGVAVTNHTAGASPGFTQLASVNAEYELCFKCHSVNSYNPNGTLPAGTSDKAVEFNTLNQSYHPVEGTGKNLGIKEIAFVQGGKWNPTSGTDGDYGSWSAKVYCTDCHGSENDADPKGAHGSNNRRILKRSVTPGATSKDDKNRGGPSSSELCFLCHDYNVYVNGNSGSRFPRHEYHVADKGYSCSTCHVAHGYNERPHLLDGPTIRSFRETSSRGYCEATCHGEKDYDLNYPHVDNPTPPPDDGTETPPPTAGTVKTDKAWWIRYLKNDEPDSKGYQSDITSEMGDGSHSSSYEADKDRRVLTAKVNQDPAGFGLIKLRFYVTSRDRDAEARIYPYRSNGNEVDRDYRVTVRVRDGWNEIDVTSLARRMNGYGWMKFRLTDRSDWYKVSEIELVLE